MAYVIASQRIRRRAYGLGLPNDYERPTRTPVIVSPATPSNDTITIRPIDTNLNLEHPQYPSPGPPATATVPSSLPPDATISTYQGPYVVTGGTSSQIYTATGGQGSQYPVVPIYQVAQQNTPAPAAGESGLPIWVWLLIGGAGLYLLQR